MRQARCVMLQGTSSHVGKSLLCTALCRIFHQDGYLTAPFKAQNMALNSTITPEGGEIGRAQGVQAEAAGVAASVLMNPLLLKPKQDMQSQLVVLGSPVADLSAREYRRDFLPEAVSIVQDCIERLKTEYEVLVIEGAGSPAEVNLKDRDIVNMKTAELAESPVLLVADIDRGGVFAALIGTLELLDDRERERVKGFIINKFRGDLELLQPGLDYLTEKTGLPVLGVIPYMHDHGIDEEDSVSLAEHKGWGNADAPIQIAVLQLPHISNFTDMNALRGLPDTRTRYVKKGEAIGKVDMLIIPGTKNSIMDLLYLKKEGYEREISSLAREGAVIAGICGGYQMLGEKLLDPLGTEAGIGSLEGLGLLPVTTTFKACKSTHQVKAKILTGEGFWKRVQGQPVSGYEIHMGQSELRSDAVPLLEIQSRSQQPVNVLDGTSASGGRIFGTYLHGIFDNANLTQALINDLRHDKGLEQLKQQDLPFYRSRQKYDALADRVRESLNMSRIYKIMGW